MTLVYIALFVAIPVCAALTIIFSLALMSGKRSDEEEQRGIRRS